MRTAGDILVVDDDEATIVFIAEVLLDEGYTVRTALTPADARTAIVKCHPDMVLLDLHLPGKSGNIFVQDLKDDGLAHIPVILMTADAQAAQVLSIEGIDYCLLKPFDLDELIDSVAKHIQLNHIA
jgi:CheY-like chemotaxis protein